MLTTLLLAVTLTASPPPKAGVFTLPEAASRTLREQLARMNEAAVRADDAAVVRSMYPRVVQAMGGRTEAQRKVEKTRLSMNSDGATILSATVGEVRGCAKAGKQIQCVVEGTQVIRVSGGRLLAETETLAFSSDDGAHWTFLGGGQDPAVLRAALPELSSVLPLRPRSAPKFERD